MDDIASGAMLLSYNFNDSPGNARSRSVIGFDSRLQEVERWPKTLDLIPTGCV